VPALFPTNTVFSSTNAQRMPSTFRFFPMRYYYKNKNNETAGPATIDDIRALAAAGEIAADPMIMPEGSNAWRALSSIDAVPDHTAATASEIVGGATVMSDVIEKIVSFAAALLSPERIGRVIRHSRLYGHYALLAGMVLTLLYSIYIAIRHGSIESFLTGMCYVIALCVGQFVAVQFLAASDKLVAATPSRLSSNAIMKCIGLISIACAVVSFFASIVTMVRFISGTGTMVKNGGVWLLAIAGTVVAALFGGIALHPSVANVEIGQGSAGEEAVGIVMFFLKINLKMLPLFFALPAISGCLVTLVSFFTSDNIMDKMRHLPPDWIASFGMGGTPLLLWACSIPLTTYLMFLLAALVFDVLRAILVLPSKIDQGRR
jgi:hypothetical protein